MEPVLSTTARRRGHQHHPRHTTRRRLDQTTGSSTALTSSLTPGRGPAQCGPVGAAIAVSPAPAVQQQPQLELQPKAEPPASLGLSLASPRRVPGARRQQQQLDNSSAENGKLIVIQDKRPAQCGQDDRTTRSKSKTAPRDGLSDEEESPGFEHADARARGDGNSDNEEAAQVEEDPELAELAKLRCPSERAEVQAEREARRRKRCADYPGLAFGCSVFSCDTMIKFSLIKNELQNIKRNQLKRVSIGEASTGLAD